MRAWVLAAVMLGASCPSTQAVVRLPEPSACSDRNALQNVAYDARLTVIQFYYKGYIENLADKSRQACLEARVLMDDQFAVINKVRMLIEKSCLPIDVAAQTAMRGLCP